MTESDLLRLIREASAAKDPLLVAIDGRCGSGKTTLAARLAETFHAYVLHTDDFVIPHAQKTKERLAVPGGNCDAERLVREAVRPWKENRPARFRRYDCARDCFLPEEELPDTGMLILEGSYCNLPQISRYADLRFFLAASQLSREERLQKRETAQSLERFHSLWIPLENAYFSAFALPDSGCIILGDDFRQKYPDRDEKAGSGEYDGSEENRCNHPGAGLPDSPGRYMPGCL